MAESSTKNKVMLSAYHSDAEETEEEGDQVDLRSSLVNLNLTLKNPRKKLLIMGIGGFLCHRVYRRHGRSQIPTCRSPDASYRNFFVYKRPYCEDFMKFCLEKFEVGIWSSAKEWNMNDALNSIMRGLGSKLLFAWKQDECTSTGFKDLEEKQKPIFLKELKKLWGEKGAQVLGLTEQYSSSNTLLIDTKPYKALLNPPHTAIFPTEYKADHIGENVLGTGSELREFLEELSKAEDVPSFVKKNPYGKPAISPQHPDWDFYSNIIRKYQE